jgi:hypothetical protein
MMQNPPPYIVLIKRTIRKSKPQCNEIAVLTAHINAVGCEKNQHRRNAGSLVTVNKRMVFDQRKPNMSRFLLQRGIQIAARKGLKGSGIAESSRL